jgi:DNA-directed RNA polymerase subunit RPC12/RpoP
MGTKVKNTQDSKKTSPSKAKRYKCPDCGHPLITLTDSEKELIAVCDPYCGYTYFYSEKEAV